MGHNGSLEIPSCYFRVKASRQHYRNGSMWVSVLKKRGRLRIGMGFGPAQVSARDGLRHETGFGSEQVQFKLSFGPRRVSARHRFWIGTGSVRVGFRADTGFSTGRVSDRNGFWADTSFRTRRVSYRFDTYRFDPYRFESNRFDQYRFESNRESFDKSDTNPGHESQDVNHCQIELNSEDEK
ncbi:hypothetical protein HanIR_Chr01g0028861 [Helianthus annuus]|nr:hypothetical protein HanIR_Chr01g0028861 [Helianthus annuus]